MIKKPKMKTGALVAVFHLSFVRWLFSSCSECLYWKKNKMMYDTIWCLSTCRSSFISLNVELVTLSFMRCYGLSYICCVSLHLVLSCPMFYCHLSVVCTCATFSSKIWTVRLSFIVKIWVLWIVTDF